MSFISYAQNLEDVMLWRTLKHVSNGFYIDVGAWSPDIDSVTRAFYENGWHGINIEPNPEFHAKLQDRRPRDINLKVAISETPGVSEMHFVENPGLSTLDPEIAKAHQATGWGVKSEIVEVVNLRKIWKEHIPPKQEVHLLKIDIEGLEEAAIRGNDWSQNRPWIVVIESTLPMSQVESHHTWEPILIESGYIFAYADGLNRFYVAREHIELLTYLKYPPNVFDKYITSAQHNAEMRATQAESYASNLNELARIAHLEADQASERANRAEEIFTQLIERTNYAEAQAKIKDEYAQQLMMQLNQIQKSKSWRITEPLRLLNLKYNYLTTKNSNNNAKNTTPIYLRKIIKIINNHPLIKAFTINTAKLLGVSEKLKRIHEEYNRKNDLLFPPQEMRSPQEEKLSRHSRQIFTKLKANRQAIHKSKEYF